MRLIPILILLAISGKTQVLSKHNLVSYGLCMIAGASDGLNDVIVSGHAFHGSQFWDVSKSWENKEGRQWIGREVFTMTSDGYHLTKFVTYSAFTCAVVLHIGEKHSWKQTMLEGVASLAAYKMGWLATYKTIK